MSMKVGGRIWQVQRMQPGQRQSEGFTIIETMVVLAITGALFVAIAATLSGRQNEAEFMHAIQSAQSQVQQVIDQVSLGYYPNNANFSCDDQNSSVHIDVVSNNQGTNKDCVFLGKVIQFGVTGTDPEELRIYTVAGLRCGTNGVACPQAGSASPFTAVDPTVVGLNGDYASYSSASYLEYGLKTLWVHPNGTMKNIGAVGFLMEPGNLDASSASGYSSDNQSVDLIPILPTTIPQNYAQAVAGIEDGTSGGGGLRDPLLSSSAPINPPNGVQICLVSSNTNQSGLLTIGGSGRQLLVKLDIKSNQSCQ